MRLSLLMAVGLLLTGCNAVVTRSPLFTRADEAGAPAPREGLWRFDGDTDCAVDEGRPLIEWPACAGGAVLKGGLAGYYERKTGSPVWTEQAFILAAGKPRIAQAQVVVSGDVKLDANPYAYAGATATKFDERGRITAFSFWPVQCGPPPPSAGVDAITRAPLPGMTVQEGQPLCTTTSVEALRNAARASQAWAPRPLSAHWVRDGGPA